MAIERPILTLDLSGPDGNVFMVIGHARALLGGEELDKFNDEVRAAIAPGAGKKYKDVLAIINTYVRLVDSSGLYPEYAAAEE